jgi:hypothetical protein
MSESLMSERLHVVAMFDPTKAAGTTQKTDVWDMQKYRQAMCIVMSGDFEAGGTLDAKLQESATSNGTFTTYTGKSITQMTTSMENSQAIINISSKELAATTITGARWCRLHLTGASATVTFGAIVLASESRFREPWTSISYADQASVIEIVA